MDEKTTLRKAQELFKELQNKDYDWTDICAIGSVLIVQASASANLDLNTFKGLNDSLVTSYENFLNRIAID